MKCDLTGKISLVTGAARGIGQAIALRLAEAGYALALGDLHPADETITAIKAMKGAGPGGTGGGSPPCMEEVGGRAFAVECDLGSPGGVALLVREVTGRLGRCDVRAQAVTRCIEPRDLAGAVPAHLPCPLHGLGRGRHDQRPDTSDRRRPSHPVGQPRQRAPHGWPRRDRR